MERRRTYQGLPTDKQLKIWIRSKQVDLRDDKTLMAEKSPAQLKAIARLLDKEHLTNVPLVALVTANVLPIYGVAVFGWNAFYIVLLYWAENLVIGFYNVLKMAAAKVAHPIEHLGKLFMIPFFVVHFGGFCAVHGMFVFFLFGKGEGESVFPTGHAWPCFLVFVQLLIGVIMHGWTTLTPPMKYAIAALFLSHGVSFVHNYLIKHEYATAKAAKLMSDPYARVVVMHFAVLFGGFISAAIGSPAGVLIVLILIKTIIDIKLHLHQHRKAHNQAHKQQSRIST